MKILMINDFYQPVGGVEIYLFNLLKALEERGQDVVVIYGRKTEFDGAEKI